MRLSGFVLLLATIGTAEAAMIAISDSSAFIHANGGLVTQFTQSSPTYFTTLDGANLGTFGWSYTNGTGASLTNVRVSGFLDADIDRDLNTFFNEYGLFLSLGLPSDAPAGAIAATSWQIDEPGFVFGTILADLAADSLRNENFVSSATPDDASLALGFLIGSLAPGRTVTLTLRISPTNIGGLQQFDPDSDSGFYLNGFATLSPLGETPSPSDVPEPSTFGLVACAVSALLFSTRKRLVGK